MRFVSIKNMEQQTQLALHLEYLPGWANLAIGDGLSELHRLDERIEQYDRDLAQAGHFCFGAVGQYDFGANTHPRGAQHLT